ncbi:MAG TPA: CBS domain-containing protein [Acidimicrobiia bacterium]
MDLDHDTRVEALVARPVVYVHPNDTLRQLTATFVEESIGAALVRGPHGTIGLVTERDIVRAISDGASTSRTTVEQIMSEDLITVSPNEDLLTAAHLMLEAEVRHLPIMENGVAAGMVSARDALRALVELRDEATA